MNYINFLDLNVRERKPNVMKNRQFRSTENNGRKTQNEDKQNKNKIQTIKR
jgi:hypothetical protein